MNSVPEYLQPIRLKNRTREPQTAWINGKGITLAAGMIEDFPREIAKEFLSQRGGFVTEFVEVNVPEELQHQEYVWVANMTGHAKAKPAEVEISAYDHHEKRWVRKKVPNPRIEAQTKVYRVSGGEWVRNEAAKDRLHNPELKVELPPFQRVALPKIVAENVLLKDAGQAVAYKGQVKVVRAPASSEPNTLWPLYEIAVYANMVDPDAFPVKDVWQAKNLRMSEESLFDRKQKILRKLFFYLVDPVYSLPPREAFDQRLADLEEEAKQAKEAKAKAKESKEAA